MLQTKYLKRFETLSDSNSGRLHNNLLRIEIVKLPGEDSEGNTKTKGGIILAATEDQRSDFRMLKPVLGVVLETGSGYYDPDSGRDIPLDIEVGNVVWVPAGAIGRLSVIPETGEGIPDAVIALVNESEVRKSWPSIKAFEKEYKTLTKDL